MLVLTNVSPEDRKLSDRSDRAEAAVSCPRSPSSLLQGRSGALGHGAWSWFADPRAVDVSAPYAETVVGWVGWNGQVTVAGVDPRCGRVVVHVVGHRFPDDHAAPAILVEPDHRLTVFWSGHNGPVMDYRSTLRAGDLRTWGPIRRLRSGVPGDLGFTYPNPVLLSSEDNRLYLFWRGANWSTDYTTRTGGRWGRARQLIRNPGERPYVKVASNDSDTIALAFTNGHPRNLKTSIFYAAYRDGWLRHASGRPIAPMGAGPILPRSADRVYDAGKTGISSWVWDVALDRAQRPVIVYATFPSAQNCVYWYARWNGQRWISHFMTYGGPTISPGTIETEYSGGLALDHADPSIVYVSRKVRGSFEIERWQTTDGGYNWQRQTLVRTPGADDVRPVVPRGEGAGLLRLLWMEGSYRTYTTYRTSIAYLR